jgi:hypothetical protein
VICGDEWAAFRLARYCQERGFYVQAIPSPVVPKGTARLRVSITAGHTQEHLTRFVAALDQGLAELGIPRGGSGVIVATNLQRVGEPLALALHPLPAGDLAIAR